MALLLVGWLAKDCEVLFASCRRLQGVLQLDGGASMGVLSQFFIRKKDCYLLLDSTIRPNVRV